MAEHCSTIESWAEPTAYLKGHSWISDAFARENEALTKALQISLSDDSSASETLSYAVAPPAAADRRSFPDRGSISGKITKRKSRASKRTPTTYINADPENFRRMVQEVTGIRFGESKMPADPAVWHEPDWTAVSRPPSYPSTLDTSALVLENGGPVTTSCGLVGSAGDGFLFDFESFPSFPTLESWGAM